MTSDSRDWHLALRAWGVVVMPSPYGRTYLSSVLDELAEGLQFAFFYIGNKDVAHVLSLPRDDVEASD